MARSFVLPEVVDLVAVTPLRSNLIALRGEDVELDASAVQRISGLGVQLLLSAAATWRQDGHAFSAARTSPALEEALRLTGARLGDEG
jgi:chemotaxis protein CheX